MYADISRDTFDPASTALRLVQEQGRSTPEAEVNEQTSILLERLRILSNDVYGPYWGPVESLTFSQNNGESTHVDTGFRLRRDGNTLRIGPGAYYAGGVRVYNEKERNFFDQPELDFDDEARALPAGDFLVYLDVSERFLPAGMTPDSADVAFAPLGASPRTRVVWQVRIRPLNPKKEAQAGQVEEPAEVAKVLAADGKLDRWKLLATFGKPGGLLPPRENMPELAAKPIVREPPDEYPYVGENQLYRLEIHRGSPADPKTISPPATFKWSRDNGAAVFPIVALRRDDDTYEVRLAESDRDERFSLNVGDWVEYVDLGVLKRPPESPPEYATHMFRVIAVDPFDPRVVTIERHQHGESVAGGERSHLPAFDRERLPFLRRWDYSQYAGAVAGAPAADGSVAARLADDGALEVPGEARNKWIALEDFVRVRFATKDRHGDPVKYARGDYWLIPARAALQAVVWPRSKDHKSEPADAEAKAPQHYYAPLAIFLKDKHEPIDCRFVADPRNVVPAPAEIKEAE
jgi:hypothetical protein